MSTPNLYDDERRTTFLATLPERLRSRASNLVLARIRAGARTPEVAYGQTVAQVRQRLGGWGAEDEDARAILAALRGRGTAAPAHSTDAEQQPRFGAVPQLLIRHRTEALDYCAWCLAWERLTPLEKDRLRAAKGEEYRAAYQDAQPPTEEQRAYLRRLGCMVEPRSKRHASELIDQLLRGSAA